MFVFSSYVAGTLKFSVLSRRNTAHQVPVPMAGQLVRTLASPDKTLVVLEWDKGEATRRSPGPLWSPMSLDLRWRNGRLLQLHRPVRVIEERPPRLVFSVGQLQVQEWTAFRPLRLANQAHVGLLR